MLLRSDRTLHRGRRSGNREKMRSRLGILVRGNRPRFVSSMIEVRRGRVWLSSRIDTHRRMAVRLRSASAHERRNGRAAALLARVLHLYEEEGAPWPIPALPVLVVLPRPAWAPARAAPRLARPTAFAADPATPSRSPMSPMPCPACGGETAGVRASSPRIQWRPSSSPTAPTPAAASSTPMTRPTSRVPRAAARAVAARAREPMAELPAADRSSTARRPVRRRPEVRTRMAAGGAVADRARTVAGRVVAVAVRGVVAVADRAPAAVRARPRPFRSRSSPPTSAPATPRCIAPLAWSAWWPIAPCPRSSSRLGAPPSARAISSVEAACSTPPTATSSSRSSHPRPGRPPYRRYSRTTAPSSGRASTATAGAAPSSARSPYWAPAIRPCSRAPARSTTTLRISPAVISRLSLAPSTHCTQRWDSPASSRRNPTG